MISLSIHAFIFCDVLFISMGLEVDLSNNAPWFKKESYCLNSHDCIFNSMTVTGPGYQHIRIGVGHRLDVSSSGVLGMIVRKLTLFFYCARQCTDPLVVFNWSSRCRECKQDSERSPHNSSDKGKRLWQMLIASKLKWTDTCSLCFRITHCSVSLGLQQRISLTPAELWKNLPLVRELIF